MNGAMGGMMGETTAMESGIERDGTSTEEMYGLSAAAGVGSGQVPRRARLASEDSQQQQQQQQAGQGMSTGASLGHSLDGSPSWNSAMTSMELSQQLDHLYRYQAQRAGSQEELVVQQQEQDQQGQERQGPPRRPDSSLAHNNSLSMTDGALQGPQRHSPMEDMTRVGSRQYSLELRRQQEEQLRRLQQQHQQHQQYMELGAAEVEGLYRPHQAPHPYMELDLSGAGPGAGDGDRYGQHHHGLHMSAGEVDGVYHPSTGEGDGMSMSTTTGERGRGVERSLACCRGRGRGRRRATAATEEDIAVTRHTTQRITIKRTNSTTIILILSRCTSWIWGMGTGIRIT